MEDGSAKISPVTASNELVDAREKRYRTEGKRRAAKDRTAAALDDAASSLFTPAIVLSLGLARRPFIPPFLLWKAHAMWSARNTRLLPWGL